MLKDRLIAQAGGGVYSAAAELAGKLDLLLFERYGDIQVLAEVLHNQQKYGRARPQGTYLEKS